MRVQASGVDVLTGGIIFDHPLLQKQGCHAITRAAPKAIRTPSCSPHTAMKNPPNNGPSAIGMRRTSECMVTPIVRLPPGNTLYIRLMVAGREMADQEMKSTAPMSTACHVGTRITKAKPGHGHQVEDQEGFFGADTVGQVTAGKGVKGREQVVYSLQKPDGQHPASQSQHVDGQEALGHALAHAHQHHHGQYAERAALKAQKAGNPGDAGF